ncbi:MAG: glucose 1-dehydrogenase [Pseudomonadales bacterium]|jgi:NAD(P)-dependent dehydrogenase (short-subunit alcohol dehydrogenase family)|nr:glucose 1-dehydrogenase [Pseudomonadales bacterium]
MGRLDGKIAVITGAASGMGAATVKRFVAEGARVVAADLQTEKGEALARELGDAVAFVTTNVAVEADVKAMIDLAVERFGGLDCLFNNAGFGGVAGLVDETDTGDAYASTWGAMFTGPLLGMKHAAPLMKARGGGSIISTASVAGLRGGYGPHVYSGIKSAVIGLTRSVALELGPHSIRANAICPGGIATPIFAGAKALDPGANVDWAEAVRPVLEKIQPIPRAGEPEDIANAALFLASDESSFVTGQALVVDGGLTACNFRHPDMAGSEVETIGDRVGMNAADNLQGVPPSLRG